MIIVSNDPAWWPAINAIILSSYLPVAGFTVVMYDWGDHDNIKRPADILQVFSVLTFGQEVELIWTQHWSLMTVVYLGVRYLGMLFAVLIMLDSVPTIPLTDTVGFILYIIFNWTGVVVSAMLWVVIIIRLHAMYQGSRKIQKFLVVTFLAVIIYSGVATIMLTIYSSGEELILSGIHQCRTSYAGDALLLVSIRWILVTVWEVLTLCLAVWIAIKHFRELRRHSAGRILGDCFAVLMKTHILYFTSFVVGSCFQLIYDFSPITDELSLEVQIYYGLLKVFDIIQIFVLGSRLILSIREYHAKLLVDSDAATGMTSIAFQERVHISTSSSV
ncbi:hypothetical protein BDR07DRAFT_1611532 [Suillus spraguei]|nr:hypothetical protein BDR07DRAFT_1611532 [Suillus spraguei]